MNTCSVFAAATLALAAATGALAAPPATQSENTASAAPPLSEEDVIKELVKFRQGDPTTQYPHNGEWYNVPAPVGYRVRTVGQEGAGPVQALPAMQRADADARQGQ